MPFLFIRDDYSVSLINLKSGKAYLLVKDKGFTHFHSSLHCSVDAQKRQISLIIFEHTGSDSKVGKYEVGPEFFDLLSLSDTNQGFQLIDDQMKMSLASDRFMMGRSTENMIGSYSNAYAGGSSLSQKEGIPLTRVMAKTT